MLRRVPQPPESGCRKCRGPEKGFLNAKLQMLDFRSRPVYLKTLLSRNGFTQITGTPSKPTLNARGAVMHLSPTKIHRFPVFCTKDLKFRLNLGLATFHTTTIGAICWYQPSTPLKSSTNGKARIYEFQG